MSDRESAGRLVGCDGGVAEQGEQVARWGARRGPSAGGRWLIKGHSGGWPWDARESNRLVVIGRLVRSLCIGSWETIGWARFSSHGPCQPWPSHSAPTWAGLFALVLSLGRWASWEWAECPAASDDGTPQHPTRALTAQIVVYRSRPRCRDAVRPRAQQPFAGYKRSSTHAPPE